MPLKILLADDSMTAQKMGVKILVDAGHTVVAVSNGAAAVKKIASERPDMAVLDIYMPGYTGLEVCERVRAAVETSKIPVLLTVGKMEMGSFKQEDATRVKADGVIIKPFEASDLLAAIKKIEEKLSAIPVEAEPDYEKTVKINVAEMFKQDSSYQEWQVTADEHKDEEAAEEKRAKHHTDVPDDVAGAPAMMGDMMGEEPVEAQAAALEAAASEAPSSVSRDAEIEPTSAKHGVEAAHAADPAFEPTVSQEHIEVAHTGKDPALVTDASEMASAFVTKFGVDNPEAITVGVAAEANIPGLYSDSAAVEEPPAEGTGELPTQDISASLGRMRDMERQHEAESVEIVEESPVAESGAAPDDDFEKRVAAAMDSYQAPAVAEAVASAPEPVESAPEPGVAPEAAPEAVEAMAAAPASAWTAHEAAVEAHEATASLDQEMLKAFSASVPVDPEPQVAAEVAPEPATVAAAPVAEATPSNAPDMELATAMAAAVSPDSPPMAQAAAAAVAAVGNQTVVDPARLAEAIHRALDRLKPELIAHIARELEQK